MIRLEETMDMHLNHLARAGSGPSLGNGHGWVDELIRAGRDRFAAVGFPKPDDEEWRFTQLAPILRTDFVAAEPADVELSDLAHLGMRDESAVELVFVNGAYSPGLSQLLSLPRGAKVCSLAEAVEQGNPAARDHLGRLAGLRGTPFASLNTGSMRDGAFIHLARGTTLELPIHLLFISVPGTVAAVSHPRVLIIAEENVEATIVESYGSVGDGVYLTNAVTEVYVAPSSRVDHCKLQQESKSAYHLATMHARVDRGGNFISHAATLGGRISRNDLVVELAGDRAEATLNGLVVIDGDQHADNHTVLDHQRPNCPSYELYKHVLSGKSSGVFKGKILVHQAAQKTDSKQTSKSLLLSNDATMNSQPALEIYADDVKCTHGSTTGPVDEDMVFYLRTRGVSLEAARHLLTYAFAADITRRMRVEPVRRRLENYMASQHGLPLDLRITDAGAHDEKAR